MIRSINNVKSEIRVLGIDTCRRRQIFGTIVRGGSYVDGVFRFELQSEGERELGNRIRRTRYFPELRVLMLHDPKGRLRPDIFEESAGLPLIQLSRSASRGFSVFRSGLGTVFQKSHLKVPIADKILSVTWTFGSLPEPARIAHLLANRSVSRA